MSDDMKIQSQSPATQFLKAGIGGAIGGACGYYAANSLPFSNNNSEERKAVFSVLWVGSITDVSLTMSVTLKSRSGRIVLQLIFCVSKYLFL